MEGQRTTASCNNHLLMLCYKCIESCWLHKSCWWRSRHIHINRCNISINSLIICTCPEIRSYHKFTCRSYDRWARQKAPDFNDISCSNFIPSSNSNSPFRGCAIRDSISNCTVVCRVVFPQPVLSRILREAGILWERIICEDCPTCRWELYHDLSSSHNLSGHRHAQLGPFLFASNTCESVSIFILQSQTCKIIRDPNGRWHIS